VGEIYEDYFLAVLVKCRFDPKMQISNKYLDVPGSSHIGKTYSVLGAMPSTACNVS
jgi:hypothetical protein